ncbi:MAG: hypothetical protein KDD60_12195, partial [Bdellovibrionales bacterium]|nr:hypothetical protein [Bdellovibrionales bacterium]
LEDLDPQVAAVLRRTANTHARAPLVQNTQEHQVLGHLEKARQELPNYYAGHDKEFPKRFFRFLQDYLLDFHSAGGITQPHALFACGLNGVGKSYLVELVVKKLLVGAGINYVACDLGTMSDPADPELGRFLKREAFKPNPTVIVCNELQNLRNKDDEGKAFPHPAANALKALFDGTLKEKEIPTAALFFPFNPMPGRIPTMSPNPDVTTVEHVQKIHRNLFGSPSAIAREIGFMFDDQLARQMTFRACTVEPFSLEDFRQLVTLTARPVLEHTLKDMRVYPFFTRAMVDQYLIPELVSPMEQGRGIKEELSLEIRKMFLQVKPYLNNAELLCRDEVELYFDYDKATQKVLVHVLAHDADGRNPIRLHPIEITPVHKNHPSRLTPREKLSPLEMHGAIQCFSEAFVMARFGIPFEVLRADWV